MLLFETIRRFLSRAVFSIGSPELAIEKSINLGEPMMDTYPSSNPQDVNTPQENGTNSSPLREGPPPMAPISTLAQMFIDRYCSNNGRKTPVIVILGAGASVAAGLPLWQELKLQLISSVVQFSREKTFYVEHLWKSLETVAGPWDPGRAEFTIDRLLSIVSSDVFLAAASRIPSLRDRIIRDLQGFLTPGLSPDEAHELCPSLLHELLAHLVKHGFIDGIISFNFDSLMEIALDHEVGPRNYELIISDTRLIGRPRGEMPWLLKLHGSAGYPSSLRFTPETTGVLSPALEDILSSLVGVEIEGDHIRLPLVKKEKQVHNMAIVSIGYSWRDEGFLYWFFRNKTLISQIHIIDKVQEAYGRVRERFATEKATGGVQVTDHSFASTVVSRDRELFTPDHYLWAVWECIRDQCERSSPKIPLMPAARHVLLCYWFGVQICQGSKGVHNQACAPATETEPTIDVAETEKWATVLEHTREKRFLAELLLHITKCKGMVTINSMARINRIRKYMPNENDDLPDLSPYLTANQPDAVRETFFSTASKRIGLVSEINCFLFGVNSPPNETIDTLRYWQPNLLDSISDQPDRQDTLPGNGANNNVNPALEGDTGLGSSGTDRSTRKPFLQLTNVRHGDFVKEQIERIIIAPEVEIDPGVDDRIPWLVRDVKPLETYREMAVKTHEILHSAWTHLLVIAETGEWLWREGHLPKFGQDEMRKILLIATSCDGLGQWSILTSEKLCGEALEIAPEKLKEKLPNGHESVCVGRIPWWMHNRHLTLAFYAPDNLDSVDFRGGVYFRRRLKATTISPISLAPAGLNSEKTLKGPGELLFVFLSYTKRCLEDLNTKIATSSSAPLMESTIRLAEESVKLTKRIFQIRTVENSEQTDTSGQPAQGYASLSTKERAVKFVGTLERLLASAKSHSKK